MRRCGADPDEILSEEVLHDLAQVLMKRSCGDPHEFLSKRPLHDPVQALTLTEDLVEILAEFSRRGPCMRNLQMLLFRRFWYHDLAGSAPAAAGPCMMILWDSLRGPGMKILLQVLVRSS